MRMIRRKLWLLTPAIFVALAGSLQAKQASSVLGKPQPPPASAPAVPADPILLAAQNLIGRALFLRAFPAANSIAYDSAGHIEGARSADRPVDWTLAGINILKTSHPAPGRLELEGVRVAVRYNPDAHEFQRHPLNDQKMKLILDLSTEDGKPNGAKPKDDLRPGGPANPTPHQLEALFAAIFSIGIDPALERSTPPLWRHYFDPAAPWPPDALSSLPPTAIYPLFGQPDQAKDVTPPVPTHKANVESTDAARTDKVKGQLQLRTVIDAAGVPQRIAVTHPVGYGLDERAAEALAKWRFAPAQRAGQPVPVAIVVNFDVEVALPLPR